MPVVPAAHYACGGVAVDGNGRTTLGHLRAVGEVSCTGVHGANRLASTSLLEGLLWGWRAGKAAAREAERLRQRPFPEVRPWQPEHEPVDPALIAQDWMVIRHTMWNYVGLLRSERRLDRAGRILGELRDEIENFYRRGTMSDALAGPAQRRPDRARDPPRRLRQPRLAGLPLPRRWVRIESLDAEGPRT